MEKLGLRTKLNFRFENINEDEIPVLDFEIEEPEEEKKEIKLVSKKRRNTKKNRNLF